MEAENGSAWLVEFHAAFEKIMGADGLSPPRRILLLAYLKFQNRRTGLAWPGIPALQKATGFSRTAVVDNRRWLIKAGLLEEVFVENGRAKKIRIKLNRLEEVCRLPAGGVPPNGRGVCRLTVEGMPSAGTEQVRENRKELTGAKNKKSGPSTEKLKKSFSEFCELRMTHQPGTKTLRYSDWAKEWKRAVEICKGCDEAVEVWRYVLTHPDENWWREQRKNDLYRTFFYVKNLKPFVVAAREKGKIATSAEKKIKIQDISAARDYVEKNFDELITEYSRIVSADNADVRGRQFEQWSMRMMGRFDGFNHIHQAFAEAKHQRGLR